MWEHTQTQFPLQGVIFPYCTQNGLCYNVKKKKINEQLHLSKSLFENLLSEGTQFKTGLQLKDTQNPSYL